MLPRYHLRRMYGRSYFGSGSAYGRVKCDSNCRTGGVRDNGFVRSCEFVEVINPLLPAKFFARGGDSIGEDGREWSEEATYVVGQGWVCSPS
jgi:hypothetical protein